MTEELKQELERAIGCLAPEHPLRNGMADLLGVLGYKSERTLSTGSVEEFLEGLGASKKLTGKQLSVFESWRAVEIVFQFTGDEIIRQQGELFDSSGFDKGRIESFVFVTAELKTAAYGRTQLTEMTRAVNRLVEIPVIVLFRHGSTVTLAAVHRRPHKRDSGRSVLERVTLVKDIRTSRPHRAHVEILADLALSRFIETGVRTFDDLHAAWERVLDIEELNRRFYRELFEWFQTAVDTCRFPDDGAGEGSGERHVIRLITRLLFIWFMKEKGLISDDLFAEKFARVTLKKHGQDKTDYYRAVLQNLFFATLNTEIDKRAFSKRTNATHRDFTKYRYRKLLADPDGFVEYLKQVPFVNGGLFDCLDDFVAVGNAGRRIDAFTDNVETQGRALHVPARLFFHPKDGLFTLFGHYKFTVEENTPLDQEVALDPELLGRVFENLLAAYNPETRETARKSTGSYYTPRQVVDYMVREALTDALAAKTEPEDGDEILWREQLQYLFDHSDAMDDADELFEDEDRRTVVAAIADIRALDPAVGSGAFPMGILQTLTMALRRIDPDNALWEEFQKERATAKAGRAFDTPDHQQRDETLREISATFQKYRDSDFGRKLYLIQNSIFGVDIQPIACQIAKLRFFISLVIEQKQDADEPNLGIRPLPNLETRFVAADTLIGLQAKAGELLLDDAVKSKRGAVAAVRERYFLADSRPQKLDCIRAEQRLRGELRKMLEEGRKKWIAAQEREIDSDAKKFANREARETYRANELLKLRSRQRAYDRNLDDARKVADWDPYDQNRHADWFGAEYMFGVADGFDVVIGNPPYIQLQKDEGRARKRYQHAGYETFASTGDIYQLFYERGCNLLTPGAGTLAYITSNSWLKAEYGKPLRRWFAERHTPLSLIEMGKDVFDAIVDTGILLVREGGSTKSLPAVDMDNLEEGVFPPPGKRWGEARPKGEAPWSILSPVEWRVLEKMKARGTPLKDWDVRINRGVLTGYNTAFIIDDATRDALVAEDPRSEEIIKPVLRGRDIRRWRAQWAGKWLIDTHNGYGKKPDRIPPIEVTDYPAIKCHLDGFYRKLTKRQDKGQTPYNLRNCAYHEDFGEEKLFWIELADEGRFAYDNSSVFGEATAFLMTGERLKLLCTLLNSTLLQWFLRQTAPTSGMGTLRWKKVYVEAIPVPRLSQTEQRPFNRLLDRIVSKLDKDAEADTQVEEMEIDRLVHEMYGLTEHEVAAIRKILP